MSDEKSRENLEFVSDLVRACGQKGCIESNIFIDFTSCFHYMFSLNPKQIPSFTTFFINHIFLMKKLNIELVNNTRFVFS